MPICPECNKDVEKYDVKYPRCYSCTKAKKTTLKEGFAWCSKCGTKQMRDIYKICFDCLRERVSGHRVIYSSNSD